MVPGPKRLTGYRSWLLLAVSLLAVACGGPTKAPVVSKERGAERGPSPVVAARSEAGQDRVIGPRPEHHVIVRGDTLYSIAWRYGTDYRELARWNGIGPPYLIYPGQRLRLTSPAGTTARRVEPPPASVRPAPAPPPPAPGAPSPPPGAASPSVASPDTGAIRWLWPAEGRVNAVSSASGKNGVEILGQFGQAVKAAASGEVVYSGSGLIGYGQLIIIKHNDTYLSAYAHNSKLLVKEGDRVEAGQQVAEMGRTGDRNVMLHFEIRRNGKPVPPLQYLPKRS